MNQIWFLTLILAVKSTAEVQEVSDVEETTNPIYDFLFGFFLFIAAIPVLWYNERRHLINITRIHMAQTLCKVATQQSMDQFLDQQLVHMQGKNKQKHFWGTKTIVELTDDEFGVCQADTMKMQRHVEMYQWVQHSRKRKNNTHYSYTIEWKNTFIDSNNFKEYGHSNDESKWIVKKKDYLNPEIIFGDFILPTSLIQQIQANDEIDLTDENVSLANQRLHSNRFAFIVQQGPKYIYFKQQQNIDTPGDMRIWFTKVQCHDVTIVSKQHGNSFEPFIFHDKYEESDLELDNGETGCCCGLCREIRKMEAPMKEVNWIFEGTISKLKAFNIKLGQDRKQTYLIRFLGWLAMVVGIVLIFSPITYLVQYVPFLGSFLATLSVILFVLVGIAVATPLAILTISIAWLYYRPLVGLILLVVSLGLCAGIWTIIALKG